MRVRMLIDVSGTVNGQTWPPVGGEIDLSPTAAARLCKLGHAEPVRTVTVETAVLNPPAETAVLWPKPLGSGWYELADGTKIRGLKAAQDACGQ